MPVQNPPIFLQAGSHPAEDVRRLFHAQMGGRPGIVGAGDLVVTQNGTPNMSVNVAGGQAFVTGTEGTYQGLYFVENRGTTNLVISAADPTNPRKDLIVARVKDAAYSGATNAWELAVITGTPAGSPSEPTVTANTLVLAMVDVPAADTSITNSQITDRRTSQTGQKGRAAALGGIITCTSTNQPASPFEGMSIYQTDNDSFLIHNGTAFIQPWNLPWGTVGYAAVTASQNGITARVDLTGLTVTLTAVAGRRYRTTFSGEVNGTVANDLLIAYITNGSNTELKRGALSIGGVTAGTGYNPMTLEYVWTGSGSTTHKVRAERNAGSGTANLFASATSPAYILIEDIGPS